MDVDGIAHRLEAALHTALKKRPFWTVFRFTPSIVAGRRYIGLSIDGKHYSVTIEVEEV